MSNPTNVNSHNYTASGNHSIEHTPCNANLNNTPGYMNYPPPNSAVYYTHVQHNAMFYGGTNPMGMYVNMQSMNWGQCNNVLPPTVYPNTFANTVNYDNHIVVRKAYPSTDNSVKEKSSSNSFQSYSGNSPLPPNVEHDEIKTNTTVPSSGKLKVRSGKNIPDSASYRRYHWTREQHHEKDNASFSSDAEKFNKNNNNVYNETEHMEQQVGRLTKNGNELDETSNKIQSNAISSSKQQITLECEMTNKDYREDSRETKQSCNEDSDCLQQYPTGCDRRPRSRSSHRPRRPRSRSSHRPRRPRSRSSHRHRRSSHERSSHRHRRSSSKSRRSRGKRSSHRHRRSSSKSRRSSHERSSHSHRRSRGKRSSSSHRRSSSRHKRLSPRHRRSRGRRSSSSHRRSSSSDERSSSRHKRLSPRHRRSRDKRSSSSHRRSSSSDERSSSRHKRLSPRHRRSRGKRSSSSHRKSSPRHRRSSPRYRRSSSKRSSSSDERSSPSHERSSPRHRRSSSKRSSSSDERSSPSHERSSPRHRRSSSKRSSSSDESPIRSSNHRRLMSSDVSLSPQSFRSSSSDEDSPLPPKSPPSSSSSESSSEENESDCDSSTSTFNSDSSSSLPQTDHASKSNSKARKSLSACSAIKPKSPQELTAQVLAVESSLAAGESGEVQSSQQKCDEVNNNETDLNLSQDVNDSNLREAILVPDRIEPENNKTQIVKTPQSKLEETTIKENISDNETKNIPETQFLSPQCSNRPGTGLHKGNKSKIDTVVRITPNPATCGIKNASDDSIEKVVEPSSSKETSSEEIPNLEKILKALENADRKSNISGSPSKDNKVRKIYSGLLKILKERQITKLPNPSKQDETVFHVNFDIAKPVLSDEELEEGEIPPEKEETNNDLNGNTSPEHCDNFRETPDTVDESIPTISGHSTNSKNIIDRLQHSSNLQVAVKPKHEVVIKPKPETSIPVLTKDGRPKDPRRPRSFEMLPRQNESLPKQPIKPILLNSVSKLVSAQVKSPMLSDDVLFGQYQQYDPLLDSPVESNSNHNSPIYTSNLAGLHFPPPPVEWSRETIHHESMKINVCGECKSKPANEISDPRYLNSFYYTFLQHRCSRCSKSLVFSSVNESLGFSPDITLPSTSVASSSSSSSASRDYKTIPTFHIPSSIHDPLPKISPIKRIATTTNTDSTYLPIPALESPSHPLTIHVPPLKVVGIKFRTTDAKNIENERDLMAPLSKVNRDSNGDDKGKDNLKKSYADKRIIQENSSMKTCNLNVNSCVAPRPIPPQTFLHFNMHDISHVSEFSDFSNVSGEVSINAPEQNSPEKSSESQEIQNAQEINKSVSNQLECDRNSKQPTSNNNFGAEANISESVNAKKGRLDVEFKLQYSPISDCSRKDESTSDLNDLDESGQLIIDEQISVKSHCLMDDSNQDANTPESSNTPEERISKEVELQKEISSATSTVSPDNPKQTEAINMMEITRTPTVSSTGNAPKAFKNSKDIVGLFDRFVDCDFSENICAKKNNSNNTNVCGKIPTKTNASLTNKTSEKFRTLNEHSVELVQGPKKTSLIDRECLIRSLSQEFEKNTTVPAIPSTPEDLTSSTALFKASTGDTALVCTDTYLLDISSKQDEEKPHSILNLFTEITDQSATTRCETSLSECMDTESDCGLPTIISRPKKRNRVQLDVESGTNISSSNLNCPNTKASNIPFKKRKYSRVSFDEDTLPCTSTSQLPHINNLNAVHTDCDKVKRNVSKSVTSTEKSIIVISESSDEESYNNASNRNRPEVISSNRFLSSDTLTSTKSSTKKSLFDTFFNLYELEQETSNIQPPVVEEVTNSLLGEKEQVKDNGSSNMINPDELQHDEIVNTESITPGHDNIALNVSDQIEENSIAFHHTCTAPSPTDMVTAKADSTVNSKALSPTEMSNADRDVTSPANSLIETISSGSDCLNFEMEQADRTVETRPGISSDDSVCSISFEIPPEGLSNRKETGVDLTKRSTFSYKGRVINWPIECISPSVLDAMSDASDSSESEEEDFVITECSVSLERLESTGYSPLCFFERKYSHTCCRCCKTICCATSWIMVEDYAKRILDENKQTSQQ